jgi:hypothetical protein
MKFLKSSCLPHVLVMSAAVCGLLSAEESWTPLFDGKSLDGWVQRGGKAKYTVEDGSIVGTSTLNTENTFLCTPRDYGDFILEYEFKVDPRLNSGVQIRSQLFPEAREIQWQGKPIKIPANRVHGYQIEIDPDPVKKRWWSTGIYEEAARGWLYPGALGGDGKAFGETGGKIFKQNDWNKVRVEAKGDSLKTFLNGEARAAITDARVASGFIGLQVHGIGKDKTKEGTQVRWRNLRIQEIASAATSSNTISADEQAAGWRLLWDGKTSKGWRSAKSPEFPKKGWLMEDGVLTIQEAGGGEASAFGDIITEDKFSDFELKVDFKITAGANSGIKIFVDPDLNKGEGSSIGPEFQILDDARHPDAKLGKNSNRTIGSLYDLIPAPNDKKVNPPGEWNHAHIISKGNHVEFLLNGVKTVEFDRGTPAWRELVKGSKYKIWPAFGEMKEGHILLQDHGNRVSYRNIKIRSNS